MSDDIKLPPMPDGSFTWDDFTTDDMLSFARAAVLADRVDRKPLTEEQLLRAIQSIGPNGAGRIALTYESGPYDIDRPTNVAVLLCRAIERAHGIVEKESGNERT